MIHIHTTDNNHSRKDAGFQQERLRKHFSRCGASNNKRRCLTCSTGTAFAVPAIRRAPRRHGVVEQQPEHVHAPAPGRRIEHVRDALLALAEHE